MAKKTFTFHLAKDQFNDFGNYLSENAIASLASPTTQRIVVENFADRSEIFVFRGQPMPPRWLRSLAHTFNGIQTFNTSSGAAILLFEVNQRVLAVTFSFGWMYLDDDKFTSDFGILVAVNGLDQTKLRRLERTNLGDALKGVSQSAFQREFRSFGIEDALDLVQKISGKIREDIDGDSMVGSRSLKIIGDYDYSDIPILAEDLLALYDSDEYQNTEFKIIDSVKPITDGVKIRELNEVAADRIKNREDNFELGLPSTVDSEGIAFKFQGPGLRNFYPDLLIRHYVAAMESRGKLETIDAEILDTHKVMAVLDDDRPNLVWKLRKALIGSVEIGAERFAINEGNWFQIDDGFRESVESSYEDTVSAWEDEPPTSIITTYDTDRNGRLEREEEYNIRLARQYGFALLDQQEIIVPGVSRSGFEPCDLLDIEGRRFIHVKKSSRTSSILSHFFKQGSNSARQFKRIPTAWTQLESKLRETNQHEQADRLNNTDRTGWTIEYWIVDSPRSSGEFNIPFFSKISLRDERLDMLAMEYQVRLRFILKTPEPIARFQR
ncbi:TIGR04141 family sporadically distributed protein [uncultured Cohaesibacter sp.]|uniref:TIGR04141 family sporadically distributed protein n=1 Tax=uncultured Cohaesibacter sp. TaxID=1002546 RepID=UPI002AA950CF|nr:TIGR04141 family sporadically distributed protein [uncultured Cohaesibacter sp.]